MGILSGKVALVTGAGRGLGRAHALALAAAGAQLVVNDLGGAHDGEGADEGPAHTVVNEIVAAGGQAVADTRSISEWDTAHAVVAGAVERFGRLDIVVNNAGVTRPTRFGDLVEGDWDMIFDVNAKGTAAIMNAAARHWTKVGPEAGRGIVNTASPAAASTIAMIGLYSASKAAVTSLTEAAAEDLAHLGVRVNAIAPVARTRMIDNAPEMLEFMAPREDFDSFAPEHAANLVLYLTSPNCRFSGRLFGIEGDQLYLFSQRSAETKFDNGRQAWTVEELASTLASEAQQQEFWAVFPGDRMRFKVPSDEVISQLAGS